jgi:glyoxylase-like metal-dependent hydrolase (beta-lactamase superfamily II)
VSAVAAVATLAGAVGCQRTPPETALLDEVAVALANKERLTNVAAIQVEGAGQNWNLGQNRTPDDPLPAYEVTEHRRRIDFAQNRMRLEQVRTPAFLTGNPAPVRQFLAVDGDVAFSVTGDGVLSRQAAYIARERRAEIRHSPVGIVRLALDPSTTVEGRRAEGSFEVVDVRAADGLSFTLYADGRTKLPAKVRSPTYHPNLGDVVLETSFEGYAEVDGVQLPSRYTTSLDGNVVARIDVARTTLSPDVSDLVAPPPVVRDSPEAAPAHVLVEDLAPGVWYLTGQSHHSVVVEFADHLTLIEAPQSEARTLAVIGRARELAGGKPVTELIPTHHHFDHSAGVRAAVAEGLVIRTHAGNRAFFEDVVARRHTIVADALSTRATPARIETFDDTLTLEDGTRSLTVYPIADSAHASPFLMVYLPKERLLVEVDAFTPPAPNATTTPVFPFAANLLDNVRRLGLRVDRVVPLHGRVVPLKELAAAATPPRP